MYFFLKMLFTHFQKEGKEGEGEGEKYYCVVASHTPPTGDLTCNPGVCPDWESNQRPFGSQPTLHPLSHTRQGLQHVFFNGSKQLLCSLYSPPEASQKKSLYVTQFSYFHVFVFNQLPTRSQQHEPAFRVMFSIFEIQFVTMFQYCFSYSQLISE